MRERVEKNKWLNVDDGDGLLSFGFWFVYDWANCKDDEEDCEERDKRKISLSLFFTAQVVEREEMKHWKMQKGCDGGGGEIKLREVD